MVSGEDAINFLLQGGAGLIFGQGIEDSACHTAWPKDEQRMAAETKKIQKIFNKELEDLKRENTIAEMSSTVEGINRRITEALRKNKKWERQIGVENNAVEQNREKEF